MVAYFKEHTVVSSVSKSTVVSSLSKSTVVKECSARMETSGRGYLELGMRVD